MTMPILHRLILQNIFTLLKLKQHIQIIYIEKEVIFHQSIFCWLGVRTDTSLETSCSSNRPTNRTLIDLA